MKSHIDRVLLFKDYLKELFIDRSEQIIRQMAESSKISFRINYLKSEISDAKLILNSLLDQGFAFDCYVFQNGILKTSLDEGAGNKFSFYTLTESLSSSGRRLSETPEFNNGLIYIQNPSSMLSVFELAPEENQNILDICAAPGSKTTMISSISNDSNIVAVEKFKPRFFQLKANLENSGVKNFKCVLSDSIGLEKKNPEYINFFDKVLVDAPCTNESRFNLSDRKSLEFWNPKKYRDLSRVQKGVLISGARMLRPGGTLVYSTCTFNPMENEAVVTWLLSKFPEMKLVSLSINSLPDATSSFSPDEIKVSTCKPFESYKNQEFDPTTSKTLRLLPDGQFEGFYIAKFTKN